MTRLNSFLKRTKLELINTRFKFEMSKAQARKNLNELNLSFQSFAWLDSFAPFLENKVPKPLETKHSAEKDQRLKPMHRSKNFNDSCSGIRAEPFTNIIWHLKQALPMADKMPENMRIWGLCYCGLKAVGLCYCGLIKTKTCREEEEEKKLSGGLHVVPKQILPPNETVSIWRQHGGGGGRGSSVRSRFLGFVDMDFWVSRFRFLFHFYFWF